MARGKTISIILLSLAIGSAMVWGSFQLLFPSSFFTPSCKSPPIPLSIGVVDINSIEGKSKFFQEFKRKLDNLNAKIYKEILEQETRLRAKYEQLKKQEEDPQNPTQDGLKQKAELDKEYAELEKTVRARREELDQQYTKGLTHIKQTLKEIMDEIGKTHGLTLILNRSVDDGNQMGQSIILFCNKGLDLTEEVIQRLDAKLLPRP